VPFRRLLILLGLPAALLAGSLVADESNTWPVVVRQIGPAGNVESWNALGPFFFNYTFNAAAPVAGSAAPRAAAEQPAQPGDVVSGFRPLYVQRKTPGGNLAEVTVLYPIFFYRSYGDYYLWSVFDLINRYGRKDGAPPTRNPESPTFDIWPFYFSRNAGSSATSYQGLFPIAGSLQGHLGYDRISWDLFPLYAKTEKGGAATTYTPWPILRITKGTVHGFAIWPLFGRDERPGAYVRKYFLWPLTWDNTIQPADDKPPGTPPKRQVGFLPFYTSERSADGVNESYLWPFFGYTDRVAPTRYHETRYFWPFLVQGRGDDRYVDRTGPFYTHSIRKGVDKTWVLWPLWRRMAWTESGVAQTKTQFFYFLYWNLEQRSTINPNAGPAQKTFFWPLFSAWDNGAGRRQFQSLGLFDVFFPDNEEIRESWTPLAALIRHDERPDGGARTSLLWNAVTWERRPAEGRSALHVGPLLSVDKRPGAQRVALGCGLVGWKRGAGRGWHFFWMEFSPDRDKTPSVAR
jgi:hypothetical protein